MDIETCLNSFINNYLALSQKDIDNAIKSREWLINRVISKINEKNNGLKLYRENNSEYITFGSYFKGTKISDADEFDIMLIIDSCNGFYRDDDNKIIGHGIGTKLLKKSSA